MKGVLDDVIDEVGAHVAKRIFVPDFSNRKPGPLDDVIDEVGRHVAKRVFIPDFDRYITPPRSAARPPNGKDVCRKHGEFTVPDDEPFCCPKCRR